MLSGRGLDAAAHQLAEQAAVGERRRRPLTATSPVSPGPRVVRPWGYVPESRPAASHGPPPASAPTLPPGPPQSGGERRRVELARILFAGSELLLLDEPTNHLDNDAKQWLVGFLRTYRGALLVVSHDLDLLDEAITRVLHLDEAEIAEYRGTYSQYRTARAADEERRRRVVAHQKGEINRLETLADGMLAQTVGSAPAPRSPSTRASHACAVTPSTAPRARCASSCAFPSRHARGRSCCTSTS